MDRGMDRVRHTSKQHMNACSMHLEMYVSLLHVITLHHCLHVDIVLIRSGDVVLRRDVSGCLEFLFHVLTMMKSRLLPLHNTHAHAHVQEKTTRTVTSKACAELVNAHPSSLLGPDVCVCVLFPFLTAFRLDDRLDRNALTCFFSRGNVSCSTFPLALRHSSCTQCLRKNGSIPMRSGDERIADTTEDTKA
jgi:hypothetical protein